jgi:hypothetical protein
MATAHATLQAIAAAGARERLLIAARRGKGGEMSDAAAQLVALVDAVRAFEDAGIAYALIGGLAVGVHSGMPRATLDVDFAVCSAAARDAVAAAVTGRGFAPVGAHPHTLNFRHANGEPVQLAFDPEFDAMIARAEVIQVGAGAVRIVGKEDLIAMKRRAAADPGRRRSKALRDEADIALLLGDVPDPDEGW